MTRLELQVSNDGEEWTTIAEHVEDLDITAWLEEEYEDDHDWIRGRLYRDGELWDTRWITSGMCPNGCQELVSPVRGDPLEPAKPYCSDWITDD